MSTTFTYPPPTPMPKRGKWDTHKFRVAETLSKEGLTMETFEKLPFDTKWIVEMDHWCKYHQHVHKMFYKYSRKAK